MLSESIRKIAEGEITSIGNILTAETTPDGDVTTFSIHGTVVLTAYHRSLGGLYEYTSFKEVLENAVPYIEHTAGTLMSLLLWYFDTYKDYLVTEAYEDGYEDYAGYAVCSYRRKHHKNQQDNKYLDSWVFMNRIRYVGEESYLTRNSD